MTDHHEYCTGDFHPDDLVISGVAGRFPLSKSLEDLKEGLMNQKDYLIQTGERFQKGALDLPFSSAGTVSDLDKFDADFFGFPIVFCNQTDPQQRTLLEVSYESIVDAGYDPLVELRGANIGVYTAVSNEDTRIMLSSNPMHEFHSQDAPGYIRTMLANRISHVFDFHGPSLTTDTACSSSFVAMSIACNDVMEGRADAAVVAGCQCSGHPFTQAAYLAGGILSRTSECNPFDDRANGIVRTEALASFFIQKASAARRAYAKIVKIRQVSSGYTPEGVYVPNYKQEYRLFSTVMREANLKSDDFQFIEAHGTGTHVGDPIEVRALESTYMPGRTRQLYVGSVKSSLGHSEAAAGLCGALKVIFAFESGVISPNQDFRKPNQNIEALLNGNIKIISEPLPLEADYVPINCFGFGGTLVHCILKRNSKVYPKEPEPEDLPRLVLYPATTEAGVLHVFDYVEHHPELRAEFFALLNKLSFTSVKQKPHRGYALYQNRRPVMQVKNALSEKPREVWYVMTGMGCQWPGMGLEMMRIKTFADSMKKSAAVLKRLDIDLFELLRKDSNHLLTDRKITPAFVTISAIQIALVDVLTALGIRPDGIIGHSTGELICAYADGCCTAEQTIISAYLRGQCVEKAGLETSLMAAVGLTWEEAVRRCPKGVYPACHNAEDSVTISGLKEPLEKFVAQLQKENIFARVVNAYGYGFHSELVWPAAAALRTALTDVLPNPQPRTSRWVSSSYPENEWDTENCKMAGAEYFVHNLMSNVRFAEASMKIPSNSIVIEIGPHFLLQSILKRSIGSEASFVGLMKRNDDNNVGFFLESLGKLYVEGLDPKIENLYRPVQFPVPRNTPMICDIIKWDHSQSFRVPKWTPVRASFAHVFDIEASDSYLLDHFIDGRSLFPATGYIFLAWKAFSKKMNKLELEDMDVVIEDFKIHRVTFISPTNIGFSVNILDSNGRFEILENNALVASGKVNEVKNLNFSEPEPKIQRNSSTTYVAGEDIYNELRIHGYQYGPHFQKLKEMSLSGKEGFVEFENWISFMDALLLFYMFNEDSSSFVLPVGALSFKVAPSVLMKAVEECKQKGYPGLPVNFHPESKICRTAGLEIKSLETDVAPKHATSDDCILEEYNFIPYIHKFSYPEDTTNLEKYMIACNKIIDSIETNRGKFSVKRNIDFCIDSYINEAGDNCLLLSALREIVGLKQMPDKNRCKSICKDYIQNIGREFVNSLLVNDHCLRYMFDIISENSFKKLNILELNMNFSAVMPTIAEVVEKYSLLKFKNKIVLSDNIEGFDQEMLSEYKIQLDKHENLASMVERKSQDVVVGAICTGTFEEARHHIQLLSSVVDQKGFIVLFHKTTVLPPESLLASLCVESINIIPQDTLESLLEKEDLVVISKIFDEVRGNLYLLRHTALAQSKKIIRVSESQEWLTNLKSTVCDTSETAWIVSQESPYSGVIGMVNCLRHEPGGDRIRCVYIPEKNKNIPAKFNFEDRSYQEVLKKDLVMNVYKDGAWGSFRHIRIDKELKPVDVDCSYLNIKKYGDLSTLTWTESAMKYLEIPDSEFVHVYYSALNFKDVMLATGKISVQTSKDVAGADNCVLGFEFSGKTKLGKRVAGMCMSRGLATVTQIYPEMQFEVPDHWSLEEAATVPVVYITCYYALIMRANLQPGESVLIHSGAGGIGTAAINIALSMQCEVFTTVGTEEKRRYLLETFPELKSENIGCSRDITFENMVMTRTGGKGVDVVLNSLADEKFYASVRCVGCHGRFVEIGKYDLALDNKLGLKFFLKNITFHGVFVDMLLNNFKLSVLKRLSNLVKEGIKNGVVKPLRRTVFQRDEAEKAFRYMGSGVHIGKVLLKIRDEEKEKHASPNLLRLPAKPMTYFYGRKVYIVIGGLGGFGIELCKWLMQKGARNLILTSRYGARTPYHDFCLKRWRDEGYNVIVSTRNVSKKEDASKLLREAADIGPVGGIFNSAVVLHDAFLENADWEDFKEVCAPKGDATLYLDALSRCFCPELDHFVCFSSISCGKGNAGQMNYGYANSVMERVCERRRADGFPGLAIQWGIIGEVGVVHRHMGDDAMIAGVGAQKVQSCLNILDVTSQLKRPVVSTYVIKDSHRKQGDQGDILQQLAKIFGLKDSSEFNNLRSFGEMGVDSMIGVEVKHLLETTCDVTLSMHEIQELKIADIKTLIEKVESEKANQPVSTLVSTLSCVGLPKSSVHPNAIERLNDVKSGVPVFIVDIESGDVSRLRKLSARIDQPVFALLLTAEAPITNVQSLATWFLEKMKSITNKDSRIVAHLSASVVALEMSLQLLQKSGSKKSVLSIVGGTSILGKIAGKEAASSTVDILCDFVENFIPSSRNRLLEPLSSTTNLEQQVRSVVELFAKCNQAIDKVELTEIILSHVKTIQALEAYAPKEKLRGDLLAIEDSSKLLANDVAETKTLMAEICSGKVTIQRIPEMNDFGDESIQKLSSMLKPVLI